MISGNKINTRVNKNNPERTEHYNAFVSSFVKNDIIDKDAELNIFKEYVLTKDISLREKIIRANSRFVFSAAKGFTNDPEEVLDLSMEGMMGLIEAIDRFDPETGNKFISFASHYVYKYMVEYINRSKLVKRSKDLTLRSKTSRIRDKYYAEHGRYPSSEEVIEMFEQQYGVKINRREYIEDITISRLDSSYMFKDGDESTYMESPEFVSNENGYSTNDIVTKMQDDDLKARINTILDILPERERNIIKMIYGIDCDGPISIEDIADEYNITIARVNQIKKSCLSKMKKAKYLIAI